jgi:hypothetical protein
MSKRFVFLRIGFALGYGKELQSGASYVKESNVGAEMFNFQPLLVSDKEICAGFYEPTRIKSAGGGYRRKRTDINNIDMSIGKADPYIKDVTVIWCAKAGGSDTSIIGWYENAVVFREMQRGIPYGSIPDRNTVERKIRYADIRSDYRLDDDCYGTWMYNVLADAGSCVCLPIGELNKSKWHIPSHRTGIGFGRANVWYTKNDNHHHRKFVDGVLSSIKSYDGENVIRMNPPISIDGIKGVKQIFDFKLLDS